MLKWTGFEGTHVLVASNDSKVVKTCNLAYRAVDVLVNLVHRDKLPQALASSSYDVTKREYGQEIIASSFNGSRALFVHLYNEEGTNREEDEIVHQLTQEVAPHGVAKAVLLDGM